MKGSANIRGRVDASGKLTRLSGNAEITGANSKPAIIHNTDNSYQETAKPGSELILPNISFTDSDGSVHARPGQTDIIATLCLSLAQMLGITTADIIYDDLGSSFKLTGVLQQVTTNDLSISLTGQQVGDFLASLSSATIHNDLAAASKLGTLVALLTNAEINNFLTAAQVQALNAAQIQSILTAQLLNLTSTQLQYILANDMSAQFLNTYLSAANRNKINAIYALQTGQTVSYATGDDGDLKAGRLTDFFTLPLNNSFGNTNRFTDNNGGQVYTVPYLINHANGNGFCTTMQAAATWANAISNSNAFTNSLYNTGWKLPNVNEIMSLFNFSKAGGGGGWWLNYAPFNFGTTNFWTSTTYPDNTLQALVGVCGNASVFIIVTKTLTRGYIPCRIHF
jgi:hypothetical protein